jgi:hypothetical protein
MCPGINTIGRELGLRGAQQQCAHNTYEISTLHTEPGLRETQGSRLTGGGKQSGSGGCSAAPRAWIRRPAK